MGGVISSEGDVLLREAASAPEEFNRHDRQFEWWAERNIQQFFVEE